MAINFDGSVAFDFGFIVTSTTGQGTAVVVGLEVFELGDKFHDVFAAGRVAFASPKIRQSNESGGNNNASDCEDENNLNHRKTIFLIHNISII